MATNYPSSLDTSTQQPTIASTDEMDDSGKEHDVVHTNHSGAIIALETKLGTGDTTASSGALLVGTGSGTSAWDTSPTISGDVTIGDTLILTGNAVSHVSNNTSANREILQLRGKTSLSDGAGLNLYGGGDNDHPNKIKMWTSNTERLVLDADGRLFLSHVEDATPGSNTGNFFIGDPSGTHLVFDNNEILAKDAADSGSTLYLQNSSDSGADIVMGDYSSGNYVIFDASVDDLIFYGSSFLDFDGTTASSSNLNIDHPGGYGVYVDNTGTGSANYRYWINTPNGGDLYLGPRSGSSNGAKFRCRFATISLEGTVSKTAGSFDIPHPTKGGDWRLRHSFIEGPTADNIYRGTITISGGSTTVDLDTVSGMTDGTWVALNTNPWSIVASSGNAVTWSLSGKTLTITGPEGAVCNWMVIGERKDSGIVASTMTDNAGKVIVEYEEAMPVEPDDEVSSEQDTEVNQEQVDESQAR